MMNERILQVARILLRFALGVTFLVSVADRFGALGRTRPEVSFGETGSTLCNMLQFSTGLFQKLRFRRSPCCKQPLKQYWVSLCCSESGNASSPAAMLFCCFRLL